MNHSPMRFFGFLIISSLVEFLGARELPTEASALEFEFEVIVAEKQKPIETLNGHYLNRLDSVEKQVQATGDLSAVLAVKKERESIEQTGLPLSDPPGDEPESLKESREIYAQSRTALEASIEQEIAPERKAFLERLAGLKEKYTQESRLKDAVAVKNLADRIASETPDPIVASSSKGRRRGEMKFKVQVDGRTYLKIRGEEVWFDHTKGAFRRPGLHNGVFPTYINTTTEWMPVWNGNVTEPFDADAGLPTAEPAPELEIRSEEGRGYAEVVEQPTAENDFTATIVLRDERRGGGGFNSSDWIGFRVSW